MTFQEAKKREKAEMNPIRYQFNYTAIPVYLAVLALLVGVTIVVGENVRPDLWTLVPIGLMVLLIVCMSAHGTLIIRKEEKMELDRWAYLFKKDLSFAGDMLETDDPETGIQYLLSERGMKVILPIKGEQVFDEAKENEYFIPWTDTEIAIASDNFARRVRLAFAVIDVSKRSVDGDYMPTDSEVHFLPLEEELLGFAYKYGLEKKLSVEWRYLQARPKDAFRQILARGYIATLLDENGKRIKREDADELYKD